MANRKILYGYQIIHGDLVIQEEERLTVQNIFTTYLAGLSYATYLEEHLNGFPHYDDEVVRKMIERVTVVDAETIRVKFRYSDLEIEQSVC